MRQTMRHFEAFEYYYGLGEGRKLSHVAKKFGVSTTAVEKWSTEFQWVQRVAARDFEAGRRLAEANKTTAEDMRLQYHNLIKATLSTFVDQMKAGKVKVTKIKDVTDLIRLDLELMGDTLSKSAVSDETASTINQLVNSIKALTSEGDDVGTAE